MITHKHNKPLNVVSMFDGISCGMVALERAGIPVNRYVAYEINENAIAISKKNWPEIEHCGDVVGADFAQYRGFDLLLAGSPCQSLSVTRSKTREHLNGKSKLFFEFARALKEIQPKYFLFENVASMNQESRDTISSILGCEPILIDSADFSAQERKRLYWTNIDFDREHTPSTKVIKDILDENPDPKLSYDQSKVFNVDMTKQICAYLDINIHDMHKRVFNPAFKCHTLTCVSGGNQQKKVFVDGIVRKMSPLRI